MPNAVGATSITLGAIIGFSDLFRRREMLAVSSPHWLSTPSFNFPAEQFAFTAACSSPSGASRQRKQMATSK